MNYPAPLALLDPLNFRPSGSVSKVRSLCSTWGQVQMEISGVGSAPPAPAAWGWPDSNGFPTDGEQGLTLCMCLLLTQGLSISQLWPLKGSATPGLKDKTTGSTFISPFLCNQIISLHGEGGEEEEEKKMFSSNQQTDSYSCPGNLQLPISYKTLGGKAFLWQSYSGKEISQLLNHQMSFSEMSTAWNISYMKTGEDPAPSWSGWDLPLPGVPKLIPQHDTCRNQGENLYRHALSDKYFQEMRICALQYESKKGNVMLCSQSPKEIIK